MTFSHIGIVMHSFIWVIFVVNTIKALYVGNDIAVQIFTVGFVLLGALIGIWIEVLEIKKKFS